MLIGLFLWIALAFNGSVGTDFVDRSFVASGLLMIMTGVSVSLKANWKLVRILGLLSLLTYLPMVWQRFNFQMGVSWTGIAFDLAIAGFLIVVIVKKTGKSLKAETP